MDLLKINKLNLYLFWAVSLMQPFTLVYADGDQRLQSLIDENHVTITHRLFPENPVMGQEVTLFIEVATDRWFAGGTRLTPAAVDELLVMQRSHLATNSTRQVQGQTWVVQQWELSVFPQKEGKRYSPAVIVSVKVNAENGVVAGKHQLAPLPMNVSIPEEIGFVDTWLAVPRFSASSTMDKTLDNLQVGDAFTQTIEISADNALAMMLPEIRKPVVDGLAIYGRPPELLNNSDRGKKEATRIQAFDFIVERSGNYQLPAHTFYWWDTENGTLQESVIAPIDFATVGAPGIITEQQVNAVFGDNHRFMVVLIISVIAVVLVCLSLWRVKNTSVSNLTPREVQRNMNRAIKKHEWKTALRWAYTWLDNYSGNVPAPTLRKNASLKDDDEQRDELERLFESAYNNSAEKPPNFSPDVFCRVRPKQTKVAQDSFRLNP